VAAVVVVVITQQEQVLEVIELLLELPAEEVVLNVQ
tara:strand:+ start:26 stop:133 length:108 start_codon:yes stop_codon:yes gene_type:complete